MEGCDVSALKLLPDLCFSTNVVLVDERKTVQYRFSTEKGFACSEDPHGLVLNIQPAV